MPSLLFFVVDVMQLQVLVEQGLGKYCDPDFIRYTSREMQEALDMTSEEMDLAAHQLMLQNRGIATASTTNLANNRTTDSNPSNRMPSPQHPKTYNQQMI